MAAEDHLSNAEHDAFVDGVEDVGDMRIGTDSNKFNQNVNSSRGKNVFKFWKKKQV